jgi:hypothetical protein
VITRETEINYIYLYGEVNFMNLAICAIIVSATVLLMQIISLAKIAGLKKIIAGLSEIRMPANVSRERYERKSGDFKRPEKRNFPEQRVRQEKPPAEGGFALAAADPVEKSLRDINMKLKHAERDQESARKRMQDPLSRGDHHRGGGRNDRDRRGHRDRDSQRGNRRDNWQDRNRTGEPQRQREEGNEADEARLPHEPIAATIPPRDLASPARESGVAPVTAVSEDFASDSLQHGRKFVVNRRQLMEDAPHVGEGISQAKPMEGGSVSVATMPGAAPQAGGQGEIASEAEIHFGRKR